MRKQTLKKGGGGSCWFIIFQFQNISQVNLQSKDIMISLKCLKLFDNLVVKNWKVLVELEMSAVSEMSGIHWCIGIWDCMIVLLVALYVQYPAIAALCPAIHHLHTDIASYSSYITHILSHNITLAVISHTHCLIISHHNIILTLLTAYCNTLIMY